MPTVVLYADAAASGNAFANPANAVGNTPTTWAGDLNVNSNYSGRWTLADPADPLTGGATQTVRVTARKGSNSGTPTLAVNLYANGSLVRTLVAATNITSTAGQVLTGTFTPDEVPNGAAVEIELVQVSAGGSPSARNSAQVSVIEWTADVSPLITTQVTASGGSTSSGSASARKRYHVTAGGASASTGTATARRRLRAQATGTSTSSGQAAARVPVRRAGATGASISSGAAAAPTIPAESVTVELWQAGAFVATLGTFPITAGVVEATFDAALLADPHGSDVELRLTAPSGVDVGAVEWDAVVESSGLVALTASASGASTSAGQATARRRLAATAAGSSTSTGSAAARKRLPVTAAGASTSTGQATARRRLAARAIGASTSTGTAAALVPIRRASASGQSVSLGQVEAGLRHAATATGASSTAGQAAARVPIRRATATGSSMSAGAAAAIARRLASALGASTSAGQATAVIIRDGDIGIVAEVDLGTRTVTIDLGTDPAIIRLAVRILTVELGVAPVVVDLGDVRRSTDLVGQT